MNAKQLHGVFVSICELMEKNKDYLIELDSKNGDGDLGLSMAGGYRAVCDAMASSEETDLGKWMLTASREFNEAAPSSLGTITSFGIMGMAKSLKGKTDATPKDCADALNAGVEKIMEKAGSKPGEKTILDALCPGTQTFAQLCETDVLTAAEQAAKAASEGSESTREMRSVHGRAAYYGDKSIGVLDGGSVVGKLIFEGIYNYVNEK